MDGLTRRRFLGGVAGSVAAAGALGGLPSGMAEALAEPRRAGRLGDVEHVVILMQENRSFDHYYGTMRGVRGYGDRSAITQASGKDIFTQPDGLGTLLPFHIDTSTVDGQDLGDLGHGWGDQHQAIAAGRNNAWVAAKGRNTMGYFTKADVPFHHALAGSFTVCDHYFCSIQGPTTPNRLYLFSGTNGFTGQGGPAIDNPADYKPVYKWTTYPERLQDNHITWQVYANKEVGDDTGAHPFVGDYGDNPLWLFDAYHRDYNSELSRRASVHATWEPDSGKGKDVDHVLAEFAGDCARGTLPQVSWIVAPYGYCEHPEARPVDGAAYTQGVLNALWSNPRLWESTVLLIDYDENDGFFDHVAPPMAPAGTAGEYVQGLSIGLGARVPMTVISPWSRGGWVNSQVFDHTSVIRFLEQWTGVHEPNITAWRRAICGDLTSCFDFTRADSSVPRLPNTAALRKQADATQSKLPKPAPPATQVRPVQEGGTRPARPLPYAPSVTFTVNHDETQLTTTFANDGTEALQLVAYRADGRTDGPWFYDVPAGGQTSDVWNATLNGAQLGIAVQGPNRFRWDYAGRSTSGLAVNAAYAGKRTLRVTFTNGGVVPATFTLTEQHYDPRGKLRFTVPPRGTVHHDWRTTQGWYDLAVTCSADATLRRRFTGHIEDGGPSITG